MSVQLADLPTPALADTTTWTWVRDRRQPQLAPWFNRQATAGLILVCDIASAALRADVPVLHYDRDYERIASVSALRHQWLVPEGTLA